MITTLGLSESEFLFNKVLIFIGSGSGDHLSEESCYKELSSQDHGQESEVEQGSFSHLKGLEEELCIGQVPGNDESPKEKQGSQESKEMHRSFPETCGKVDGKQVEIAFQEAVEAIFCFAVLSFPVYHYLLPYPVESGPFGDDGDIAVHFAIYLYTLDHIILIGFQSAVKVVQLYSRHLSCSPVIKLGWDGFRDGVITLFLPS